jgi:hypothetical protein
MVRVHDRSESSQVTLPSMREVQYVVLWSLPVGYEERSNKNIYEKDGTSDRYPTC